MKNSIEFEHMLKIQRELEEDIKKYVAAAEKTRSSAFDIDQMREIVEQARIRVGGDK